MDILIFQSPSYCGKCFFSWVPLLVSTGTCARTFTLRMPDVEAAACEDPGSIGVLFHGGDGIDQINFMSVESQ